MPYAALTFLYPNYGSLTGRSQARSYHDLHNTEIKRLTSILRNFPSVTSRSASLEQKYWNAVKEQIYDLPTNLHSLSSRKPDKGNLCSGHSRLNAELTEDVWEWVRYEFDHGIGHFLYPLIVQAGLSAVQELKVRQLEPVLEMWRCDFTSAMSVPEGREPLCVGEFYNGVFISKWKFQHDKCPACMLARIGSDWRVCFALLTGMVGRRRKKYIGTRENVKSKRVRWVRYWLKGFRHGGKLVDDAWDLGEELRRTKRAWETHIRHRLLRDFYGRVVSYKGNEVGEAPIEVDISEPFDPASNATGRENANPATSIVSEGSSIIGYGYSLSEPFIPNTGTNTSPNPDPTPRTFYSYLHQPKTIKYNTLCNRSSSIYSTSTFGTPLTLLTSNVPCPQTNPPNNTHTPTSSPSPSLHCSSSTSTYALSIASSLTSNDTQILSPELEPLFSGSFHSIPSNHPQCHIPAPSSLRSQKGSVEPAPLRPSDISTQSGGAPKWGRTQRVEDYGGMRSNPLVANHQSMYTGFREVELDDDFYDNVSRPRSPAGAAAGENEERIEKEGGFKERVLSGIRWAGTETENRSRRESTWTKNTRWSDLYDD
ncbi:uncharacterized protein BDR25DRAFT_377561 [Lindgomyces ingoldianus]|uniref:Uncharacterized protein n=1 Tax=Lindgomyces ingoldianus TaxID=673940 RepID=A0ACB6QHE3_9PLEO|nr:uncharacterized protein BDR25DRAFT_377561 [Lindgomyces ingoldianus]KAF2466414.1 hypothetical protein BDR25DRAFT_377561 [Lindgomyces ingoldianus]